MEFIKSNLSILIPTIIAIISGFFNIYQYSEKKKLKKYTTEKDLKRRKASLERLENEHGSNNWLLQKLGEKEKEKNDYSYRKKCLLAEIEYLEKSMEQAYRFCQSCGYPLKKDKQGGGTEKDGSKSIKYCSMCYANGEFLNPPEIDTAEKFQKFCIQEMKKDGMNGIVAWVLTRGIPRLERWRKS